MYNIRLKRSSKDTAFVYVGFALRYVSTMFLLPYYSHVLGPGSYGRVLSGMALMNIVWLAVNYGFSVTGARELAATENMKEWSNIVARQLVARLLLILPGIAVAFVAWQLSPVLRTSPSICILATVLGLLQAFNLGWFFQGIRRFRTSIAVEALTYPINLAFVILFVHSARDADRAFIGLIAASTVSLATAYYIALRPIGLASGRLSDGLAEIRKSTSLFLPGLNALLLTSGSTYMLSIFATPAQVGYYGISERIVALGLSLLAPLAQVFMPTITRGNYQLDPEIRNTADAVICVEVCYGVAAFVACFGLSNLFVPLFLGSRFAPASPILQILAFALPLAALSHAICFYILIPLRQEKIILISTTLSAVISASIAVFAAARWGALGIAWTRVFGEALGLALIIHLSVRAGLAHRLSSPVTMMAKRLIFSNRQFQGPRL